MAAWHFNFGLIPTDGLQRELGAADVAVVPEWVAQRDGPEYLEPEELERLPNYWSDPSKLRQIAMAISSFMPEMKSWSAEARMFGNDEDDLVEVWEDDVRCRINLRKVDYELLEQLLAVARRFDCKVVVSGTGVVSDADLASLAPHVETSSAYKFCRDPAGFLATLKNPKS